MPATNDNIEVKIRLPNDQAKSCSLGYLTSKKQTLEEFVRLAFLESGVPESDIPMDYTVSYLDNEGDKITASSETEFKEGMSLSKSWTITAGEDYEIIETPGARPSVETKPPSESAREAHAGSHSIFHGRTPDSKKKSEDRRASLRSPSSIYSGGASSCSSGAELVISDLVGLIKKHKAHVQKQNLAGQDAAFVFGETRVGKSTFCNWLFGRHVEEQKREMPGRRTKKSVLGVSEPMEGWKVGHTTKSETFHITGHLEPKTKMLFCDPPGNGDTGSDETNGSAKDIAAAVAITGAIRSFRTVRPILLLSAKAVDTSGGGGLSIRNTLDLVSRFLTKDLQKNIGCLSIFFTHVPGDKRWDEVDDNLADLEQEYSEKLESLKAKIEAASEAAEVSPAMHSEKATLERTVALLERARHVLSTHKEVALLDNERMQGKPDQVLELLRKVDPISNPAEAFGTPLPEGVSNKVEMECQKLMGQLQKLSGDRRGMKQPLEHLQILGEYTCIKEIQDFYDEAIRDLIQAFNHDLKRAEDALREKRYEDARTQMDMVDKAEFILERVRIWEDAAAKRSGGSGEGEGWENSVEARLHRLIELVNQMVKRARLPSLPRIGNKECFDDLGSRLDDLGSLQHLKRYCEPPQQEAYKLDCNKAAKLVNETFARAMSLITQRSVELFQVASPDGLSAHQESVEAAAGADTSLLACMDALLLAKQTIVQHVDEKQRGGYSQCREALLHEEIAIETEAKRKLEEAMAACDDIAGKAADLSAGFRKLQELHQYFKAHLGKQRPGDTQESAFQRLSGLVSECGLKTEGQLEEALGRGQYEAVGTSLRKLDLLRRAQRGDRGAIAKRFELKQCAVSEHVQRLRDEALSQIRLKCYERAAGLLAKLRNACHCVEQGYLEAGRRSPATFDAASSVSKPVLAEPGEEAASTDAGMQCQMLEEEAAMQPKKREALDARKALLAKQPFVDSHREMIQTLREDFERLLERAKRGLDEGRFLDLPDFLDSIDNMLCLRKEVEGMEEAAKEFTQHLAAAVDNICSATATEYAPPRQVFEANYAAARLDKLASLSHLLSSRQASALSKLASAASATPTDRDASRRGCSRKSKRGKGRGRRAQEEQHSARNARVGFSRLASRLDDALNKSTQAVAKFLKARRDRGMKAVEELHSHVASGKREEPSTQLQGCVGELPSIFCQLLKAEHDLDACLQRHGGEKFARLAASCLGQLGADLERLLNLVGDTFRDALDQADLSRADVVCLKACSLLEPLAGEDFPFRQGPLFPRCSELQRDLSGRLCARRNTFPDKIRQCLQNENYEEAGRAMHGGRELKKGPPEEQKLWTEGRTLCRSHISSKFNKALAILRGKQEEDPLPQDKFQKCAETHLLLTNLGESGELSCAASFREELRNMTEKLSRKLEDLLEETSGAAQTALDHWDFQEAYRCRRDLQTMSSSVCPDFAEKASEQVKKLKDKAEEQTKSRERCICSEGGFLFFGYSQRKNAIEDEAKPERRAGNAGSCSAEQCACGQCPFVVKISWRKIDRMVLGLERASEENCRLLPDFTALAEETLNLVEDRVRQLYEKAYDFIGEGTKHSRENAQKLVDGAIKLRSSTVVREKTRYSDDELSNLRASLTIRDTLTLQDLVNNPQQSRDKLGTLQRRSYKDYSQTLKQLEVDINCLSSDLEQTVEVKIAEDVTDNDLAVFIDDLSKLSSCAEAMGCHKPDVQRSFGRLVLRLNDRVEKLLGQAQRSMTGNNLRELKLQTKLLESLERRLKERKLPNIRDFRIELNQLLDHVAETVKKTKDGWGALQKFRISTSAEVDAKSVVEYLEKLSLDPHFWKENQESVLATFEAGVQLVVREIISMQGTEVKERLWSNLLGCLAFAQSSPAPVRPHNDPPPYACEEKSVEEEKQPEFVGAPGGIAPAVQVGYEAKLVIALTNLEILSLSSCPQLADAAKIQHQHLGIFCNAKIKESLKEQSEIRQRMLAAYGQENVRLANELEANISKMKAIAKRLESRLDSLSERDINDATIKALIRDADDSFKEFVRHAPQACLADHAEQMVRLKHIGGSVSDPRVGKHVTNLLKQLLSVLERGKNFDLHEFAKELEDADEGGVGQQVMDDFKDKFEAYWNEKFNENTKGVSFKDALARLQADNQDVQEQHVEVLGRAFKEFEDKFHKNVREAARSGVERLVHNVKRDFQRWKAEGRAGSRVAIPTLLAGICACVSMHLMAKDGGRLSGGGDLTKRLRKPHAVQVLALFRLLRVDEGNNSWALEAFRSVRSVLGSRSVNDDSHLIQIGTGEGKSIVLGVLSVFLGLCNFDVDCVCYSQVLSKRDYAAFENVFRLFDLGRDRICYATFDELSKRIIDEDGNVQEGMKKFLHGELKPGALARTKRARKRILLIDEVDTFFSSAFYGQLYTPNCLLQSAKISAMVHTIWRQRDGLTWDSVTELAEYKAVVDEFPSLRHVIEFQVADMVAATQTFTRSKYNYEVEGGRLGIVQNGSLDFKLRDGYNTVWQHFHEFGRNNIAEAVLNEVIGLQIVCGRFSYAEVPKPPRYSRILGVTGTLTSQSDFEQSIVKKVYRIERKTVMCSMYGSRDARFFHGVHHEATAEGYHRKITDEACTESENGRAVLVFFECVDSMNQFLASEYGTRLKRSGAVAVTSGDVDEINRHVRFATKSGAITLFPKVFGRGLDFVVFDKKCKGAGGVHVIQTFLSKEESEEVQIMGRTCRQGGKGSYKLILLHAHLLQWERRWDQPARVHKFFPLVTKEEIEQDRSSDGVQTLHSLLAKKRREWVGLRAKRRAKQVDSAMASHRESLQLQKELLAGGRQSASIHAFLARQNKRATQSLHICFVLDESGSMAGSRWQALQNAVRRFLATRNNPHHSDVVSIIQFTNEARITLERKSLATARAHNLVQESGKTSFAPGLALTRRVIEGSQGRLADLTPLIVFMTDGDALDHAKAQAELQRIKQAQPSTQFHFVLFANNKPESVTGLKQLAECVPDGHYREAGGAAPPIETAFAEIASSLTHEA